MLQEFGRIFYEHQKSVLWGIGEYVCALCTISPNMIEAFSKGGHGFGMAKQNLPSDHWIERFGEWLQVQGFLA